MNENNTESKGLSIASMVLGIVSLVLSCIVYISVPCAILAIIFGIIGMKKGNIIFEGSPNDVINIENLKKLYEIEATLIKDKKKGYPICMDYSIINEN